MKKDGDVVKSNTLHLLLSITSGDRSSPARVQAVSPPLMLESERVSFLNRPYRHFTSSSRGTRLAPKEPPQNQPACLSKGFESGMLLICASDTRFDSRNTHA